VTYCMDCEEHASRQVDALRNRGPESANAYGIHGYCFEYGEGQNIQFRMGDSATMTDQQRAENAVDAWYAEIEIYNHLGYKSFDQKYVHRNFKSGGTVGHFTQVVWRDTTKVGMCMDTFHSEVPDLLVTCACAMHIKLQCTYDSVIVANYSPGGNGYGSEDKGLWLEALPPPQPPASKGHQ